MWLPVLVYVVLLGTVSLTRTHYFIRDAMNYVDVARNIARGQGITQSAIGFNQITSLADAPIAPIPFTAQPPLYSLTIAGFHLLFGIDFPDAALLIAVVGYACIIVMVTLIARALYGAVTGLLVLGSLCLYLPGLLVASSGWSEPLAVTLVTASLYCLLRAYRFDRYRLALIAAAGLMAGLAFATRYVLILLVPVGLLFLLTRRESWRRRFVHALVYGLMATPPVLAVLGFNLLTTHRLLPAVLAARLSLTESANLALSSLFGAYYLDTPASQQAQLNAAAAVGLGLLVLLLGSRQPIRIVRSLLFEKNRVLLTLWSVSYIALLIYWRTRSFFDNVTGRLLFPGSVALLVLVAALIVRTTHARKGVVALLALAMILFASVRQAQVLLNVPVYDSRRPLVASPRLSWIAQNTGPQDLIIGMDGVDIPFYLDGGRVVVSFSQYPYNNYLTYDVVHTYACRYQADFRYIFLVLQPVRTDVLLQFYGPFVTDLFSKRVNQYSGLRMRGPLMLRDGAIYRISCAA